MFILTTLRQKYIYKTAVYIVYTYWCDIQNNVFNTIFINVS